MAKEFGPSYQVHWQEPGLEMEQLGIEPILPYDTSFIGTSLTHYTNTMLAYPSMSKNILGDGIVAQQVKWQQHVT